MSMEAQFCKTEAVPEMDGDDGFTTGGTSLRAVCCTLGHWQDGKCYGMYILTQKHFKNKNRWPFCS